MANDGFNSANKSKQNVLDLDQNRNIGIPYEQARYNGNRKGENDLLYEN